jgi:acetyl-CoA acetyltransferase
VIAAGRRAAIVGWWLTEQGKLPHRTTDSLAIEAFRGALADAGLEARDVDGIATSGGLAEVGRWARQLDRAVVCVGSGSPGAVAVAEAAAFISAGLCETVVVVHARAGMRINPAALQAQPLPPQGPLSAARLGLTMPAHYAMMARRYMHEFGATSEQLACVAVNHRRHAVLNPRSVMGPKGEITVDDVLASRPIADPLRLLDCCIDNDGGYAFVMTTLDRARDLRRPPVAVLGAATLTANASYDELVQDYHPSTARETAARAFAQAGVTRDELDVLGLYDCFTITVLRLLEDLGFCGLGEAGPLIESGALRLGGRWPTNTDGGLMSHSHNGAPAGMHVIEVARQLWGDVEPARQVKDARLGLCHHQGMAVLGRHGTCILGRL